MVEIQHILGKKGGVELNEALIGAAKHVFAFFR